MSVAVHNWTVFRSMVRAKAKLQTVFDPNDGLCREESVVFALVVRQAMADWEARAYGKPPRESGFPAIIEERLATRAGNYVAKLLRDSEWGVLPKRSPAREVYRLLLAHSYAPAIVEILTKAADDVLFV